MDSLPPLPPPLQQQIDQTVTYVYQQAFDALRGPENWSCLTYISYTAEQRVLLRVREAIASAKREQNRRLSLQNRLPPEVWCDVWQHLSFADRIAVTHVCSAWRDSAINAPALWKHVEFYTTRHSFECYCTDCKDDTDFRESHAPGWDGRAFSENTTNVTAADILLSRSRALNLSIAVFVPPCQGRMDDLATLAHSLSAAHIHRLRSLFIYAADLNAPETFLCMFPALPMLRSLFVQTLSLQPGQMEPAGSSLHYVCLPAKVSLPGLEILNFSSRFLLLSKKPYSAVRSLAYQPSGDPEWELHMALLVCPAVERLTLDLGVADHFAELPPEDAEWWRERIPRSLRIVRVTGVPAARERMIRAAFPPTHPSLSLEYSDPQELDTGGGILCDLESDIHLSVTLFDGALSVRGVGPGGARTRAVSVCLRDASPLEVLSAILADEFIERWQRVTAVTADSSLWPLLVALLPFMDSGKSIKTLCLAIDREVRKPAPSRRRPWPQFTALRSLTLACGPHAVTMTPGEIHALVHTLHFTLPLATLQIDHRLCAGDTSEFKDLAESVSIGVYTVFQ